MVQMVKMGPNPNYTPPKGNAEAAAIWASIKKEVPKTVTFTNAMECAKNSGGMYAILREAAAETSSPGVRMPEDMTADELKLTALQLGVDLSKPMKKSDLVKAVRLAMDKVQLLDDGDSEDEA